MQNFQIRELLTLIPASIETDELQTCFELMEKDNQKRDAKTLLLLRDIRRSSASMPMDLYDQLQSEIHRREDEAV